MSDAITQSVMSRTVRGLGDGVPAQPQSRPLFTASANVIDGFRVRRTVAEPSESVTLPASEDPNDPEVRLQRLQRTGEANAAAIQQETAERKEGFIAHGRELQSLTNQFVAMRRDFSEQIASLRTDLRGVVVPSPGAGIPAVPVATTAYNWKGAAEAAWAAGPALLVAIGASVDVLNAGMSEKDMLLWAAALGAALWRAGASKVWSVLTTREPVETQPTRSVRLRP
jgi:hypothetical protein